MKGNGYSDYLTDQHARLTQQQLTQLDLGLQSNYHTLERLAEQDSQIAHDFADIRADIQTYLNSQPRFIPNPERDNSQFYYRNQQIPYIPRQQQQTELKRFLDAEAPLLWFMITGAGGSGKSRLALALIDQVTPYYEAGFWGFTEQINWNTWQPLAPLLLVIDYAASKTQTLLAALAILNNRKESLFYPVRFLLIERRSEGQWWEQFYHNNRDVLDPCRYAEPYPLSQSDNQSISQQILKFYLQHPATAEQWQQLLAIDPLCRPLYALFLADSLQRDPQQARHWNRDELMAQVMQHELHTIWKNHGVTPQDKNLLTLATMIGAIDLNTCEQLLDGKLLPADNDAVPSLYPLLGSGKLKNKQDLSVYALEPDIIGEFFVLQHLQANPNDSFAQAKAKQQLYQLAWQHNPIAMGLFSLRAIDDFADHPAITVLLQALETRSPELAQLWASFTVDAVAKLGKAKQAELAADLYQQLKKLVSAHDGNPELVLEQAKAAFNLITAYRKAQQFTKAECWYRALVKLVSAHDGEAELILRQVQAAFILIYCYGEAGKTKQAESLQQQLAQIFEEYPAIKQQIAAELANTQ